MGKDKIYQRIIQQVEGLTADEDNLIANLANTAAVVYHNLEQINWAGFYLWQEDELVLGPFQGKSACIRIPKGDGVCGTAIATEETLVVPDVDQFPGHIACDSDSQSEIVVPIIVAGEIQGVLDLDSPIQKQFSACDQEYLEEVVAILIDQCQW
ncbi:GAF domain-containing protein [Halanaerobaculum tunisiense]